MGTLKGKEIMDDVNQFTSLIQHFVGTGECAETLARNILKKFCPEKTRRVMEYRFRGVTDEAVAYAMFLRYQNPHMDDSAMDERLLRKFG